MNEQYASEEDPNKNERHEDNDDENANQEAEIKTEYIPINVTDNLVNMLETESPTQNDVEAIVLENPEVDEVLNDVNNKKIDNINDVVPSINNNETTTKFVKISKKRGKKKKSVLKSKNTPTKK